MDFSYLTKLDVKNRTARCTLYEIDKEPTFIVKPATQSNSSYFNALLRGSRDRILRTKKGAIDDSMIKQNRKEDKKLFPRHIIIGWENVFDASGKEVLFSVQNCEAYLDQLPDWLFDKLRDFAASNENFVEETIDVEVMSKN